MSRSLKNKCWGLLHALSSTLKLGTKSKVCLSGAMCTEYKKYNAQFIHVTAVSSRPLCGQPSSSLAELTMAALTMTLGLLTPF